MIRVAFLIDTIACDTAGTQKQLLETIKRLDRSEFSPHLICLWESEWMRLNKLPCACMVLDYNGFLKLKFPSVIRRLLDLIHRFRFDIIQTFFEDSIFVGYLGGVLARSRPILLSSRRDMGLGSANRPGYHRLYGLALPFVNKSFAGVVANSPQIKEYVALREKTSPSKIKVIYNGIDIPVRTGKTPELIREQACDVWIGVTASLTPVKRHDLFLHAFARLKAANGELRIKALFLGDGPEKVNLLKLAEHLNIGNEIFFAGSVDDVGAYLQHLDIGVLCSDREGLSNAIMEYMAFSLPVIATSVGGNVELVDKTNGICVPPGGTDALAGALQKLVSNPLLRKSLGNSSYLKLSQNYSWPKTMSALENYYRGLVSARRTNSNIWID